MIRFKLAETENRIGFALDSGKASLAFKITAKGANVPAYTGETIVTPTLQAQTLPTKNKTMPDDVTVLAIPVNQALNESNGYTVWIGGI